MTNNTITSPLISNLASLQHDMQVTIATAKSRFEKHWKNDQIKLSDLYKRLGTFVRGEETYEEYLQLSKTEQDKRKDIGGFVGGVLKEGRRKSGYVANRSLITLDVDHNSKQFPARTAQVLARHGYAIYSTRKHSSQSPRYRLIVPVESPMTADEYEPCARMLAHRIGIDFFDQSTFQPQRLMYWPSVCSDVEPFFYYSDKEPLDKNKLLNMYDGDWRDFSLWPGADMTQTQRRGKKAGDPREKPGAVGAFCRVYDIHQAIATFLPDTYKRSHPESKRYTYAHGTTFAGLITYDDGTGVDLHAYSNHGTDPAHGQNLNAFDLVRVHLFGDEDKDSKPDTPINRLPSSRRMTELALQDKAVKRENMQIVDKDALFDDDDDNITDNDEDQDWRLQLQATDKGQIKNTVSNLSIIVRNDESIKDKIRYNIFESFYENSGTGDLLYDTDVTDICVHLSAKYFCEYPKTRVQDALETHARNNRAYHPVKDYLESLTWDGTPRMATMFSDYLGVEDSQYTREVATITMLAAVARIYQPGIKFDTVPILDGAQDLGKSSFITMLGKYKWFTELNTFDKKRAVEETQGKWIVELCELSANTKHEIEEQKAFITSTEAQLRPAYARYSALFKRQFIMIGTTNEQEYLKDFTGNRRYLPLTCTKKLDFSTFAATVDQLWAEAYHEYQRQMTAYGEVNLLLSDEAQPIAKEKQEEHRVVNDLEGVIRNWLEKPASKNRYNDDDFDSDDLHETSEGESQTERDRVCIIEVWEQCLGNPISRLNPSERRKISAILNNTPGWEHVSTMRFGKYGRQRGWRKTH